MGVCPMRRLPDGSLPGMCGVPDRGRGILPEGSGRVPAIGR